MQSLAPWNPSFSSALSTELEKSRFISFNFSNTNEHGWPSTRTCVFRGFLFNDRSTNVILFTTDKRSAKYRELLKDSRFEACFYFTRLNKQFRMRGHARVISDSLYPELHIMERDEEAVMSSAEDDDETIKSRSQSGSGSPITTPTPEQSDATVFDLFTDNIEQANRKPINDPLEYVVISPSVPEQEKDASFTSLQDMMQNRHSFQQAKKEYLQLRLKPPTPEEWASERLRCWNMMSRNAKKTFKKPMPGSLLTEEKSKLLDSIDRNVDGTTSSSGYENFAVVCLFVDVVDYLDLGAGGADSRYVYKRLIGDDWKEYQVCP